MSVHLSASSCRCSNCYWSRQNMIYGNGALPQVLAVTAMSCCIISCCWSGVIKRSRICTILDRRQWEILPSLHQHVLRWWSHNKWASTALVCVTSAWSHMLTVCISAPGQNVLGEIGHILQTSTFSRWGFGVVGFFWVFWKRSVHSSVSIRGSPTSKIIRSKQQYKLLLSFQPSLQF